MLILVSRRAALIAMFASLPVVGTATYFYMQIIYDRWPLDMMYHQMLGELITSLDFFVVPGYFGFRIAVFNLVAVDRNILATNYKKRKMVLIYAAS